MQYCLWFHSIFWVHGLWPKHYAYGYHLIIITSLVVDIATSINLQWVDFFLNLILLPREANSSFPLLSRSVFIFSIT